MISREKQMLKCYKQTDVLFPFSEHLGCFAHTQDHVGETFYSPTLLQFWGHWIDLFSQSRRAKTKFLESTGEAWHQYCRMRWWFKNECFYQLFKHFNKLLSILDAIHAARFSNGKAAAAVKKMLEASAKLYANNYGEFYERGMDCITPGITSDFWRECRPLAPTAAFQSSSISRSYPSSTSPVQSSRY